MAAADKFILDRLTVREAQLYQQADAIDVKASILLVAVIFFAGQTIGFLHDAHSGFMHYEQITAAIVEFVAAGILARLLRIQKVYIQEAAEDYPAWRGEIVAEVGQLESQIEDRMVAEIIPDLAQNCTDAHKLNGEKGTLLIVSFWTVIAILIMNLILPILHVLGFTS